MVLNVPKDLQLSLLEFIANLNAENYDDVPDDLVKLQFVPNLQTKEEYFKLQGHIESKFEEKFKFVDPLDPGG